jgi:hypothetical protein
MDWGVDDLMANGRLMQNIDIAFADTFTSLSYSFKYMNAPKEPLDVMFPGVVISSRMQCNKKLNGVGFGEGCENLSLI